MGVGGAADPLPPYLQKNHLRAFGVFLPAAVHRKQFVSVYLKGQGGAPALSRRDPCRALTPALCVSPVKMGLPAGWFSSCFCLVGGRWSVYGFGLTRVAAAVKLGGSASISTYIYI